MIRKYTPFSSWNEALSRFPQCLDIDIQDGSTLLHLAALDENISAMDFLVHHNVSIDSVNAIEATPLMVAAYKGCVTSVEWLLKHDADVLARDFFSLTALHVAADIPLIVDMLVNHGASLDQVDEQESTPLMIQITRRHQEAAKALVAKGACVTAMNAKGGSALLYALVTSSFDLVPSLIESGASWTETDSIGRSLLARLVETRCTHLQQLVDMYPSLLDLQACSFDQHPLTRAIELDVTSVAKLLIERGISLVRFSDKRFIR